MDLLLPLLVVLIEIIYVSVFRHLLGEAVHAGSLIKCDRDFLLEFFQLFFLFLEFSLFKKLFAVFVEVFKN